MEGREGGSEGGRKKGRKRNVGEDDLPSLHLTPPHLPRCPLSLLAGATRFIHGTEDRQSVNKPASVPPLLSPNTLLLSCSAHSLPRVLQILAVVSGESAVAWILLSPFTIITGAPNQSPHKYSHTHYNSGN